MATIHPSRLALVPQSSRDTAFNGRSSLPRRPSASPRRRSPSANRMDTRNGDDYRYNRDKYDQYRDKNGRDRSRHRSMSMSRSRSRSRSKERVSRTELRDNTLRARRPSPAYGDYRRQSTPPPAEDARAPWRKQENMYAPRRGREDPRDGERPPGGLDFFESRRLQRANNSLNIWPPSPKAPSRSFSRERSAHQARKHKRDRSRSSTQSDTDSEEERRRRKRKEKKRAKKDKERVRSDTRERGTRNRTRSKSRASTDERDDVDADLWVEKAPPTSLIAELDIGSASAPNTHSVRLQDELEGSDDNDVGPMPVLNKTTTNSKKDERQYGGALLRGEGSAMAAFLQEGTDARIPRRGEIGLTSDEIAKYEAAGYVMSGSRHRVMNAVRMRKENQVISAEEKRGILKLQQEERERREMILREEFQELLKDKLKGTESTRRP